ncbi:MAG: polysaccharide deacetylase family protein [bacterium]|nr:polysaccharide deacetylase family protein [bacterium]
MKKLAIVVLVLGLSISSSLPSSALAQSAQVESSKDPNVIRTVPITRDTAPLRSFQAPAFNAVAEVVESLGPNLIQNPSFEQGATTIPSNWEKNRWSNNTGAFNYPVSGFNSGKAAEVTIVTYTGGDAKWFFNDVSITAGKTYQFSNYSLSNTSSILTIRYKMTDGTYTYKYLATVNSSSTFQKNTYRITTPANVTAITVFHLLQSVGTLSVDEYALNEVTTTTTPPPNPTPTDPQNLIKNPGFESGAGDTATNWTKNRWGANNATFSYPVAGVSDSKAAKVTLSNYSSGDAKWVFEVVNVTPGTYKYSDQYSADKTSTLTVQFFHANGTVSYKWLKTLPISSGFSEAAAEFVVPSGVSKITVFHYIQTNGSITLDNVVLKSVTQTPPPTSGIFSTGAISLAFDDASDDHNDIVVPKLNNAGFKGTFYIPSRQLLDNGFSGYMSRAEVVNTHNFGHEIGGHTRTHAHLTSLSASQKEAEIAGGRQDLQAMNVGPVSTFAYPFGEYDLATLNVVENAGYSAARTTMRGYVKASTDEYQLPEQSMESDTTFAQAKQWIDTAINNKQWLILTFHLIDNSGDKYSTTPEIYYQIVDYLAQKKPPVITVAEGIQYLNK